MPSNLNFKGEKQMAKKDTAVVEEVTEAAAPEATQTVGDPNQVNLFDLRNVVTIIDVASERGAFRGAELSQVGQVRDKFARIVDSLTPKQEAPAEGAAAAAEGAAEGAAAEGAAAEVPESSSRSATVGVKRARFAF